ncbi:MAG TPA: HAD family hydrolase [Mycobacteriales bacterium]|jgi:HAD superfamily hydrolase (TIGR01509 family)|nr:HAD family hydrolase [Mycobacteriales bacterium]
MPAGILFDVDGTLVDTNYLHVVAWSRALRANGHHVPMRKLHETVGQGADRFVETVLGHSSDAVSDAHTDFYGPFLHELTPFDGAAELLRVTKKAGLVVVLATSASAKEAQHLRDALDADDVIDEVTSKDDVEESKPDPDIVQTALDKAGLDAEQALFVGDTVWDVEAARRAGLDCVAVLSGGIPAHDLRDAGAVAIYRDVRHLLDEFDDSPLAKLVSAG